MAAYCRFEDRVYPKLIGLEVSVDMFRYSSRGLCRFGCIIFILGFKRFLKKEYLNIITTQIVC